MTRRTTARALVALLMPMCSVHAHTTTTTTQTSTLHSTTTITVSQTSTVDVGGGSTTLTVPSASASIAYSGTAFQSAVLNSTNYFRTQYDANPVTWNDTLASFAQTYAQGCIWEHSGGPYGENLAENFETPTLAIDAWADEERKYDWVHPHYSDATGHFTQLVWQNTTSVGCGAVQCNNSASDGANGWLLVCEYSPRGNIVQDFKTMVLKPGISADGKLGLVSGAARSGSSGSIFTAALVAACAFLASLV